MALAPCAECGAQISTNAAICPQCGTKKTRPPRRRTWPAVALAGLVVLVGLVAIAPAPESAAVDDGISRDKKMIELCWQEQGRKSVTAETARVIAGTCEQLEEEFIKQHGRKP